MIAGSLNPIMLGQIAAVGSGLLLDTYTGAAFAWSVSRKLKSDYTGAAYRVKRSSDNTELDIGFLGDEVDTAAAVSFVGSGTGTVTIYDQSGNGRNTTNFYPKIIISGVLQQKNGKPSISYDGAGSSPIPYSILRQTNYFVSCIASRRNTNAQPILGSFSGGSNTGFLLRWESASSFRGGQIDNDIIITIPNFSVDGEKLNIISMGLNSSGRVLRYNNVTGSTTNATQITAGSNDFNIAGGAYSSSLNGQVSEVVGWHSDEAANRSAIESNQIAYYGI